MVFPLKLLNLVGDMVTTGFSGVEGANIQFGDTVVVIGIGPVGLMSVAGAAIRGAGRLIAVGHRELTKELAKKYGATDVVDYKDGDIVAQIMELTNNEKVDRVIIAKRNGKHYQRCIPDGEVRRQHLQCCRLRLQ